MTTTKILRLRWLRFKRHLGTGPAYRRRIDSGAPTDLIDDFYSAAHGTRGFASSADVFSPRTLPGRQTWRGPAFALLALLLLTLATVAHAAPDTDAGVRRAGTPSRPA